jgi:hypothetical protein
MALFIHQSLADYNCRKQHHINRSRGALATKRATHSLLTASMFTKIEKVHKSYEEITDYCLTKY